jgi:hypothetical protein
VGNGLINMSSYSELSRRVGPLTGDGSGGDDSQRIELTAEQFREANKRSGTLEVQKRDPED